MDFWTVLFAMAGSYALGWIAREDQELGRHTRSSKPRQAA